MLCGGKLCCTLIFIEQQHLSLLCVGITISIYSYSSYAIDIVFKPTHLLKLNKIKKTQS